MAIVLTPIIGAHLIVGGATTRTTTTDASQFVMPICLVPRMSGTTIGSGAPWFTWEVGVLAQLAFL
jgi:hypothetical protein